MAIDQLIFVGLRGYVLALDRDTGEVAWSNDNLNSGPTTLLLDGDRLRGDPAGRPAPVVPAGRRDWLTFGGGPGRNMVNLVERNLPTDWGLEPGRRHNVKWVAKTGSRTYGALAVAGGRVFVGTN